MPRKSLEILCSLTCSLLWAAPSDTCRQATWVTDGEVKAIVESNGKVYIGGDFQYAGPYTGGGVPVNASTGLPAAAFPKINGTVEAVCPDGGGGWFVGGAFSKVNGVPRGNIAHILSNGTLDAAWNATVNIIVRALAISGNTLYVGGFFDSVGGQKRNNIAALDASSGTVTDWNPDADGDVWALAVLGNMVYAGGRFDHIGGKLRYKFAALDTASGNASDLIVHADNSVLALAVSGTTVYAGGDFSYFGAKPRNHIAALDVTTGKATDWNPDANFSVWALAVSGTTIYAGGTFTYINGKARYSIAALDTSGNATSWDPHPTHGDVNAIAISGSMVYVGGGFDSIGGRQSNHIGAVSIYSGQAIDWPNADGYVVALAVSGSTLFAGGGFDSYGCRTRNNIAALDAASGIATDWNPDADGTVYALTVSGSAVYAGGAFSHIGGHGRNKIAALDTNGNATAWNPDANNTVFALAVSGTTVYAGGKFTGIGGLTRTAVAALDATSGNATTWAPNANGDVYALAISGTTAYAGGKFTSIGGQTRNRIAALDMSGNATAWNPGADDTVSTLAVSGANVYAGGTFTRIGGQTRNRIASLDMSGNATAWNPNANGTVNAIAVNGSLVYAGGKFAAIGGQTRHAIAALDATSGNATTWAPDAEGAVSAVAVSGTAVYAGGLFRDGGQGIGHPDFAQFGGFYPAPVVQSLSPSSGMNNGAVHITDLKGVNFRSGASVKLSRAGQPDITAADVAVASSTRITCTFDITNAFGGAWDVAVANDDGKRGTLSNGFTVISAPPVPVSPVNASVDVTLRPTLTWHKALHDSIYALKLSDSSNFNLCIINDMKIPDTFLSISPDLLANKTTYYWKVAATKKSGEVTSFCSAWLFTTLPQVPGKPDLVAPLNNATAVALSPTLVWSEVTGAAKYRLQVSSDGTFTPNVFFDDSTLTTTGRTVGPLSPSTTYYWRVNARNTGGTGAWSEIRIFSTVPARVDAPALASPANGATNQALNLSLAWNSLAGASTYRVQLSTTQDFNGNVIVDDSTLSATTRAVGPLATDATYYWRVNAKNAGGSSAWSETWGFTTAPPAPAAPEIVLPVNGSAGVPLPLRIGWNRSNRAVSYRLHISLSPDFSPVRDTSGITDTVCVVPGLTNNARYYCRVNASNPGGASAWSPVCSLTTIVGLPSAVSLLRPSIGDTVQTDSALLVWAKSGPNVTRYMLNTASDSQFVNADIDSSITDTLKMRKNPAGNATRWWRVRACNAAGWGPWSAVGRFVAARPSTSVIPREYQLVLGGLRPQGGLIKYGLPKQSHVSLRVYDLHGKMLLSLVDEVQRPGMYGVHLSAFSCTNGYRIIVFKADDYIAQKKLLIIR